ncbi:Protein kinase-like domain [Pseudocohnilembus persalinus]|uniref:Protein kinase-like domain n=1 Tax=Pseudocohnilembus persalinus TaxID=266149 RepID=A0A0V0QBS4_PSEPJ|nr:Protein kinase-like domain [Pseudocohnilembus persalinus]|eukprot:KRW99678.1 Protein kinase-like domain [Pseudocohnilembus persalinus]
MKNRYNLNIPNQGIFKQISEFTFIIDPTRNKDKLGTGSFGEMDLNTMVSQQELKGLELETKTQITLDHPNIVKLFDVFVENDKLYMVMEWIKNGNLYSYLFKKKTFSEQEAFKYFFQTCMAFEYVHQRDIVHRDLKPENILLDDDYNIKLCDFGWCSENIEQQRNTFCGTLEYMAPEIIFQKPYDYKIDIWALGILLFELTHGHAPFKAKQYKEIKQKLTIGEVKFSSVLSHGCRSLIASILQSNPKRRITLQQIFQNQWVQEMLKNDKMLNIDKNKYILGQGKQKSSTQNVHNIQMGQNQQQYNTNEIQLK